MPRGVPRFVLFRARLVNWILDPSLRLVSIYGTPGLGRTTVLEQAAAVSDGKFVIVRLSHRFEESEAVRREIDQIIDRYGSAITIALDDFDWVRSRTTMLLILDYLEQHLDLRFVTVSVDRIAELDSYMEKWSKIGPDQLYFTYSELLKISQEYFSEGDSARSVARELHGNVRSDPLSTMFLLERHMEHKIPLSTGTFADVVPAMIEAHARFLPASATESGFLGCVNTLGLCPDFTVAEAVQLLGER